jgi:glycerol-1-phosphate dehydrogenase [NAD(P)+]
MSDALKRLIDGTFPDPRTGAPVPSPIRTVVIDRSLDGQEADLVASVGLGGTLAVVSDPDTEEALGARVARALSSRFRVVRVVLPRRPDADEETQRWVQREGENADAFIAVGSGTVNDLCKYTAGCTGKPWAVFATAPSMNGYTSKTASMRVAGMKRTLPARMAEGVFMDLRVLAAAPARLIRAGVGDSVCRPACQVDWLLANRLRGDEFLELPYILLAEDEKQLFAEPEALLRGDLEAHACLARVLSITGLNVVYCGGSHPGSQGEHLLSHFMEMQGGRSRRHSEELSDAPAGHESFHGEQIGVTSVTMARLQQLLLARDRLEVRASGVTEAEFVRRYGPTLAAECWKEFRPKRLTAAGAEALNARLAAEWPSIRRQLSQVAWTPEAVSSVLERMGAPTRPGEVGWNPAAYREAVLHAAEMRNRYTFLDLARDAALLDRHFIDAELGIG